MNKDCPFCGGKPLLQTTQASYGYYAATVFIACENSIFPKTDCFAKTRPLYDEDFKPGKGMYSIRDKVIEESWNAWNRRA